MDNEEDPRELLRLAIQAATAGDRNRAYLLLRRVIASDPSNEVAWLWLVAVAEQPREARIALRRVEQLNPNHPKLPEARHWLEARLSATPATSPSADVSPEVAGMPVVHPPVETQPTPPVPVSEEEIGDLIQERVGEEQVEVPRSEDTAPREPLIEESKPVVQRRPWPKWVIILLILAVAAALALLVFSIWLRSNIARSASLSVSGRDKQVDVLQPALNVALSESRWADVVSMLETFHRIDSSDPRWQHSAANAYFQLSVMRRKEGDLPSALDALNKALQLAPDEPPLERERRLLSQLLGGIQLYNGRNWQSAIEAFSQVYAEDPSFAEVGNWLYGAYFNLGITLQDAGQLVEARQAFHSALSVRPEQLEAQQKIQEVTELLRPPTPTASPTPTVTPTPTATPTPDPEDRLILVDISEQRMYVYENDRLLWNWVVSTGEPGKDTATGRYRVLDKIEMAYASTWNLDMPYWLGIYYSGPLENGIHALPINRTTGVKLWEGLLGQRVSYGCVILSDENARTLFEWAQVGTPVVIQW